MTIDLIETDDTDHRGEAADRIIRKHMGIAMAGGAIPIPLVDLTAVTAVQLAMLKQLAGLYRVPFDPRSARAFVTSLSAALAGTTAARVGASLFKFLPAVGALAGGAAQVVLTGASTYAVGHLFARLFQEGRTIDQLDVATVRNELMTYFEAGREIAMSVTDGLKSRANDARDRIARKRD